jgi:hypothetical protein
MLPKIIVSKVSEKKEIYDLLNLSIKNIMEYEGSEAKVDDLRGWILNSVAAAQRNNNLKIVIMDADTLSNECQAILLKPLEELRDDLKIYLIVKSEQKLLPTIVSRCLVETIGTDQEIPSVYWNEVRKCFASGPAACIAFSDTLDKDEAKDMIKEVIIKLKTSLDTEINSKRLLVIENALSCLADLEGTNINQKLTVDNFLISSWRLIKA